MHPLLKKHSLPFSIGTDEVIALLKQQVKKLNDPFFKKCSSTLWKKVQQYVKTLKKEGISSHLALAHISKDVGYGIFLKPSAKTLKPGTFIGIYAGELAMTPADDTEGNSYAYDLIEEFFLKKDKPLSIKTDGLKKGNFTRFINHSSYKPNMDALTRILPDGTVEIFLITKRKIRPGEQLLSPYGGGYWKAINIIPKEIAPNTYMLQKDGKVLLNALDEDVYTSDEAQEYFHKFRNALGSGTIEDSYPSFKKVSKILAEQIDLFDEEVTERGIPRHFALCKIPNSSEWGVFLRPDFTSIRKGDFLGVYGGKYTWVQEGKKHDDRYAFDLFTTKRKGKRFTLKIDAKKEGNFTREIKHSSNPNVEAIIYLYKDEGPQVLFFAKNRIEPGQPLLADFGKRYIAAYGGDLKIKPDTISI
jgi:hypothetical protein